jgi:hypothetical protein
VELRHLRENAIQRVPVDLQHLRGAVTITARVPYGRYTPVCPLVS